MKHGSTVLACLITLMLARPIDAQPVDWEMDQGVQLGCSNTDQSVFGYRDVSDEDLIVNLDQGGGAATNWAGTAGLNFDRLWGGFDAAFAEGGKGVFMQVCVRKFGDESTRLDEDVAAVLDMLIVDRNIPPEQIFISALQRYPEPGMCGKSIPIDEIEAAVDRAIAATGVNSGPLLVAESLSWISNDNCHLSAEGQQGIGQQMADFFDTGDVPPPPPPPEPGDPLLVPVMEVLPECADEGWIAWSEGVLWGCDGNGGLAGL